MTIETFTPTEFEQALPASDFVRIGFLAGELTYRVFVDALTAIEVRSSIHQDGKSAGTGEDSIRVWLVDSKLGNPLGSKVSRWIARTPGWQKRLQENIETLREWRRIAGNCYICQKPKGIFVSKTEKNPNRPFSKCKEHGQFTWLDADAPKYQVGNDFGPSPIEKAIPTITKSIAVNDYIAEHDRVMGRDQPRKKTEWLEALDTEEPTPRPTRSALDALSALEDDGETASPRGAVAPSTPTVATPRVWSAYQLAVFDFIKTVAVTQSARPWLVVPRPPRGLRD